MTSILLLIIGVLLVVLNIKAVKKEKWNFKNSLEYSEENMNEIKQEIGNIRREFAETLLENQREIENLKIENENLKHIVEKHGEIIKYSDEAVTEINKNHIPSEEINNHPDKEKIEVKENNVRLNEINELINQGFSIEEICEKLRIGRGELLLIKELYLK